MSKVPGSAQIVPHADGLRGPLRHLPGLTNIRGVAAWWVVLFHFKEYIPSNGADWISDVIARGYLAVDLFFILSGFIIAYNYLHLFQTLDVRNYLHFLGLRLARIYPLHLFLLAIFLINPIAIAVGASQGIDHQRYEPLYYFYSLLLLQNWGFTRTLAWNVPAWSISTEWFVYLSFPVMAWIANRSTRSPLAALAGILLPLAILALTLNVMGITLGGDIPRNGLARCIFEFLAGIFVYRLWRLADQAPIYYLYSSIVIIFVLGCYLDSLCDEQWAMPTIWACIVLMLAQRGGILVSITSNRIFETIGTWSYSTYLCHYFIRDWIKFLLVRDGVPPWIALGTYLAVTLMMSALLYRFVELPGRRSFRNLADYALPMRRA